MTIHNGLLIVSAIGVGWLGCGGDVGSNTTSPDGPGGGSSSSSSSTSSSSTGGEGGLGNGGSGAAGGIGGAGGGGGAGSSGGAGGSGGSPEPVGDDTCPGTVITLEPTQSLTLFGTTDGMTNDYTAPGCGATGTDGPDVVYQITLTEPGTFSLDLQNAAGEMFDAVVYFQTSCGDAQASACLDYDYKGEFVRGHFIAGTYNVIVDGAANTSGSFWLEAKLDPVACGDGVVAPIETCDDGNDKNGDGCSSECAFEAPPIESDVCPGEPFPAAQEELAPGNHVISSYTTGFTDDYVGSCSGGVGGSDRIFRVVPSVSGTLTAKIGYEADGVTPTCYAPSGDPLKCRDWVLYASTTCGESALACSDNQMDGNLPETLTIPVVAGTPYYIVVDGFDDQFYSYGSFDLMLNLQ